MVNSSLVLSAYNNSHCEKRPFPFAVVHIPFHDWKKGPLKGAADTVISLLVREIKIPDRKRKSSSLGSD